MRLDYLRSFHEELVRENLTIYGPHQPISEWNFTKTFKLKVQCRWQSMLQDLPRFLNLTHLDFRSVALTELPKTITALKRLTHLDIRDCGLTSLPVEIAEMKSLSTLLMSKNQLGSIPESLCVIQTLHTVEADNCAIERLPEWLSHSSIKMLSVSSNRIVVIPSSYLRMYWMRPVFDPHDKHDQKLVLTNNRWLEENCDLLMKNKDLSLVVAGSGSQSTELPSLLMLSAITVRNYSAQIDRRHLALLPLELKETLSQINGRLCDRCKRRSPWAVTTIRLATWENIPLPVEYYCCSWKCAKDPQPLPTPSVPPLPKMLLLSKKVLDPTLFSAESLESMSLSSNKKKKKKKKKKTDAKAAENKKSEDAQKANSSK